MLSQMPPSFRNDYGDLSNGYDLEIHIVNHCNLNCAGCNHFAPLAKPWYISIEEFQHYLFLIKKYLPKVKRFLLLGGEPTLHPQLLNLCRMAREQLSNNVLIEVLTNGLLLSQYSDKENQEFKELNIIFSITPYPLNNLHSPEQLQVNGHFLHSRLIFQQTLVNLQGTERADQYLTCSKSKAPCFTLKDYKIYICPFCAYVDNFAECFNINIPEDTSDYILLDDNLTEQKLIEFCQKPKNKCRYCVEHNGCHPWGLSDKSLEEYTVFFNDLYFTNYKKYEYFINNIDFIKAVLNNPNYYSKIDRDYQVNLLNKLEARFLYSKIDLIIPYYQVTQLLIEQLGQVLKNQTFIKQCTIYLISDNSPQEKDVINYFSSAECSGLNCVFLKNEINLGPGEARNKGMKYAQGEYLFFLDFDDSFVSNDVLEIIYYQAKNEKADAYFYKMLERNKDGGLQPDGGNKVLLLNSFINEQQLKFPPLYINEDGYFYHLIYQYSSSKNLCFSDKAIYIYERYANIDFCIGSSYDNFIKTISIVFYYACYALNNYDNFIQNQEKLYEVLISLITNVIESNFIALNNIEEKIELLQTIYFLFKPFKQIIKNIKYNNSAFFENIEKQKIFNILFSTDYFNNNFTEKDIPLEKILSNKATKAGLTFFNQLLLNKNIDKE